MNIRLINFLRKPRFFSQRDYMVNASRYQWGYAQNSDQLIPTYSLSILGIINGLSKRYILVIDGAEHDPETSVTTYANAKLRIRSWKSLQTGRYSAGDDPEV